MTMTPDFKNGDRIFPKAISGLLPKGTGVVAGYVGHNVVRVQWDNGEVIDYNTSKLAAMTLKRERRQ